MDFFFDLDLGELDPRVAVAVVVVVLAGEEEEKWVDPGSRKRLLGFLTKLLAFPLFTFVEEDFSSKSEEEMDSNGLRWGSDITTGWGQI